LKGYGLGKRNKLVSQEIQGKPTTGLLGGINAYKIKDLPAQLRWNEVK